MADREHGVVAVLTIAAAALAVLALYGSLNLYLMSTPDIPGEVTDSRVVETDTGKYAALIRVENDGRGRWLHLGVFTTREDAHMAVERAREGNAPEPPHPVAGVLTPVTGALALITWELSRGVSRREVADE